MPYKYLIVSGILLVSSLAWAQTPHFTYSGFEDQFMDYEPGKRPGVSDKDYEFAQMVIRETKAAVTGDPEGFNIADYWNISTAFVRLNLPKADLQLVWQKVLASDGHCEYLTELQQHTSLDQLFPEEYQQALLDCQDEGLSTTEEKFDLETYAQEKNLDLELLRMVHKIEENDQRFRSTDGGLSVQQQLLDRQNQQQIDALYQKHGTYLGRSLVGDRYAATMWQVIQHSNLDMMENYLPIIHKAVQQDELGVIPLKMLLDRIYTIKYDYQIFGSQQGIPLGSARVQEEVRRTYLGE